MFGRKKQPPLPTMHPDVRHFRRRLRAIEYALGTLSTRTPGDLPELRRLADDHATYRRCLREHGIIHPAPVVKW